MAGEAAEFLIALGDAVTPNAIKIAESVETMSAAQIKAVSASLRLDAAVAKGQSARARAAADIAKANAAMQKSQQTNEKAGNAAQELGGALEDLGGQAASVGGPVGKVQGILAKLGPEGQAAAIAIGVLTIAVTATVGTLLALGAAAISVVEHLGLLRARFAAFANSTNGGRAVVNQMLKLGEELPFATEQIESWVVALNRAGLAGRDLAATTKAVAAAAALKPQGGAEAAQDFFSKLARSRIEAAGLKQAVLVDGGPLREMGLTLDDLGGRMAIARMRTDDLAKAVQRALAKKGGGVLEEMKNTWPVISQKAKEGFLSIFEGLDEPVRAFMGAVKSLFGEFGRGKVLMGGTRGVVTNVFTTLFSWATKATNAVHKGFLIAAIGALTAYIAMRPIIERLKQLGASTRLMLGLKVIFVALVAPIVLAVAAFTALAVIIGTVTAILNALAGVIVGAIVAAISYVVGFVASFVGSIVDAFMTAYDGARAAGGSFVDGIVAGIVAGVGRVVDAVKGLASSALDAFKSTFGIKSPSKVMLMHGQKNIAEEGLAEGIDRGAPVVADAMARLGGEPAKGSSGGANGQARGASGGGPHYHFHYTGPADQAGTFFERAESWLETLDAEAPA